MSIAAFGAIHLDTLAHADRRILRDTSTPARLATRPGGVAANVARALTGLAQPCALAGAVGRDNDGDILVDRLNREGIDVRAIHRSSHPTGRYLALHDPDGGLAAAVVDGAITDALKPADMDIAHAALAAAGLWFLEANLPEPVLAHVAQAAGHRFLAADAVSIAKAARLEGILSRLDMLFCNCREGAALLGRAHDPAGNAADIARALVSKGVGACLVSDGPAPLALATAGEEWRLAVAPVAVRDVTGAGDALIAGTLAACKQGRNIAQAACAGLAAARVTVQAEGAAPASLTRDTLERELATTGSFMT
ncbi:carbohydrate kinase family protein [Stappia sp. ES.058]|uniref:carbohydrate kinase family protein n=1 Tax=Stappia sp. ES.058 TaxID=1881061 RepID=UPI00087D30F1|nr:PfkB family carbohydrate kinase [Stappia sp. ES.058]SDU23875.1 pseudouridine kinase [Stappia sp. ES.058]